MKNINIFEIDNFEEYWYQNNNKLTTKAVADSLDLEYTSITKLI